MSSEAAVSEVSVSFDALGRIVDAVGGEAVRGLVAVARVEWAAGRPGPVLESPEGAEPSYSLVLDPAGAEFRLGADTGAQPLAALVALADHASSVQSG